jgi:hypothetical protein
LRHLRFTNAAQHQLPKSDVDMLAVVHAMCVYQILGFFDGMTSEQTRAAESKQMFFLKVRHPFALTPKLLEHADLSLADDEATRQAISPSRERRTAKMKIEIGNSG